MKSWSLFVMVGMLVAGGAVAAGAQTQGRPSVYRATDPATGAEIRASQTAGGLVLEVAAPGVTLTRRASGGRIVTVVRAPKDELTLESSRSQMVVSGRAGRVVVTGAEAARLREAQALVAASPAAAEAVRLLGRISLGQMSPLSLTLKATRALLLGVMNDPGGREALGEVMEDLRTRPVLTRVALQSSPTDCWNAYVREAIAAYTEFDDCVRNSSFLGDLACAIIYDMRAIGAFSWWMSCVALGG